MAQAGQTGKHLGIVPLIGKWENLSQTRKEYFSKIGMYQKEYDEPLKDDHVMWISHAQFAWDIIKVWPPELPGGKNKKELTKRWIEWWLDLQEKDWMVDNATLISPGTDQDGDFKLLAKLTFQAVTQEKQRKSSNAPKEDPNVERLRKMGEDRRQRKSMKKAESFHTLNDGEESGGLDGSQVAAEEEKEDELASSAEEIENESGNGLGPSGRDLVPSGDDLEVSEDELNPSRKELTFSEEEGKRPESLVIFDSRPGESDSSDEEREKAKNSKKQQTKALKAKTRELRHACPAEIGSYSPQPSTSRQSIGGGGGKSAKKSPRSTEENYSPKQTPRQGKVPKVVNIMGHTRTLQHGLVLSRMFADYTRMTAEVTIVPTNNVLRVRKTLQTKWGEDLSQRYQNERQHRLQNNAPISDYQTLAMPSERKWGTLIVHVVDPGTSGTLQDPQAAIMQTTRLALEKIHALKAKTATIALNWFVESSEDWEMVEKGIIEAAKAHDANKKGWTELRVLYLLYETRMIPAGTEERQTPAREERPGSFRNPLGTSAEQNSTFLSNQPWQSDRQSLRESTPGNGEAQSPLPPGTGRQPGSTPRRETISPNESDEDQQEEPIPDERGYEGEREEENEDWGRDEAQAKELKTGVYNRAGKKPTAYNNPLKVSERTARDLRWGPIKAQDGRGVHIPDADQTIIETPQSWFGKMKDKVEGDQEFTYGDYSNIANMPPYSRLAKWKEVTENHRRAYVEIAHDFLLKKLKTRIAPFVRAAEAREEEQNDFLEPDHPSEEAEAHTERQRARSKSPGQKGRYRTRQRSASPLSNGEEMQNRRQSNARREIEGLLNTIRNRFKGETSKNYLCDTWKMVKSQNPSEEAKKIWITRVMQISAPMNKTAQQFYEIVTMGEGDDEDAKAQRMRIRLRDGEDLTTLWTSEAADLPWRRAISFLAKVTEGMAGGMAFRQMHHSSHDENDVNKAVVVFDRLNKDLAEKRIRERMGQSREYIPQETSGPGRRYTPRREDKPTEAPKESRSGNTEWRGKTAGRIPQAEFEKMTPEAKAKLFESRKKDSNNKA